MKMTVVLHDNHIYGLTKKQASPTSPRGLKSNTTPRGAWLDALNPLTVTLGVQNVSFVAQVVDWMPEAVYEVLARAFRHPGFAFVRVIQRCTEFLPDLHEPFIKDPSRILVLTHDRGLHMSDKMQKVYRNTRDHDPADLDAARRIASEPDPIPVGILYWDPEVPRYEQTRSTGRLRTTEEIRAGLEAEFDKFTIWPRERAHE